MKTQIEINAPINKVFDLFIDHNNFPHWKIGFKNCEHISGSAGELGAVAKLSYKRFAMMERVLKKDRPNIYTASYEYLQNGKTMMEHIAENKFTALSADKTLVEINSNVQKVNGFFNKLLVRLMSKSGEKQLRDQLMLFKKFAEK